MSDRSRSDRAIGGVLALAAAACFALGLHFLAGVFVVAAFAFAAASAAPLQTAS